MWSNKYIGIPYKANGRDNTGLDCWGLARLVYSEEFNITLPSFSTDYDISDNARISELIAQYREGWKELGAPEEGSLVLFKVLGAETHIGIAISESQFVHVREGSDVALERFDSVKWAKRISGHFKYSAGAILNAIPHPLRTERITVPIPEGTTLTQMYEWINKEYKISTELNKRVHILVNSRVITEDQWATTILKDTDVVEYRAVPGKDAVRLVLTLVVAYVAFTIIGPAAFNFVAGTTGIPTAAALASSTFAAQAAYIGAQAAAMIVGGALINAIAPIRPPSAAGQPAQSNPQLQFSGASNQFNPYGAIPVILGKIRLTPPVGAATYITYGDMSANTGTISSDVYLNMLLVWGYGPLHIDLNTLRIGNTALTSFTNVTKSVISYETEPSDAEKAEFKRLYSSDVAQVFKGIPLTYPGLSNTIIGDNTVQVVAQDGYWSDDGGGGGAWIPATYNTIGGITYALNDTNWVTHSFTSKANTITVSIHYPEGFRKIVLKGKTAGQMQPGKSAEVVAQIRYNTGTAAVPIWSAWGNAGVPDIFYELNPTGTSMSVDAFTSTHTLGSSSTPFEIRVRRLAENSGDSADGNYHYYNATVLQTITTYTTLTDDEILKDPPNTKIAKTAINIKATDQLNSQVEGINAIVQTIAKVWNGTNWDSLAPAPTSNPAALFYYILTHPANPQRILSGDVATKINLAALGDWYTYCANNGFEHNAVLGTQRSVLEVLRDVCAAGRASPALVDGKWTVLIDRVKDTVVQHFSTHNSWGFESTKVLPKFPDGLKVQFYDETLDYEQRELIVYDAAKSEATAELFESIQLPGVTNAATVEKHARWHFAQMKLRPEIYTLNADIEYLVCNRGDRVKVTHDVPMWGLGSGRIKTKISDTILELDEPVIVTQAGNYNIRVRTVTGTGTASAQVASATAQIKNSYDVTAYSVASSAVTLTLNDTHAIQIGDIINVNTSVGNINTTVAEIKSVTSTTITYNKGGVADVAGATTGTAKVTDSYYTFVKLTSAIAAADYGDLFLYGELNTESEDLIVLSVEPTGGAKSARLTLVDYGVTPSYNIFTQYENQTNAVKFLSNITLPPTLLIDSMGEAKPLITTANIKSDESVMELISPGVFRYRLSVPYTVSTDVPSTLASVEGQINFASTSSDIGVTSEIAVFDNGTISFTDVQEGVRYKVRLRYVGKDGRTGKWTEWVEHKVVGKSSPPSNVTNLVATAADTSINLSWTQCPELDYATTTVKYYAVGTLSGTADYIWANATLLFEGSANTWDWIHPNTGNYVFLIKHKDTSDNFSATAATTTLNFTLIDLAVITVVLTKPNPLIAAASDGTSPVLSGSGTEIRVFENAVPLLTTSLATPPNATWKVSSKVDSSTGGTPDLVSASTPTTYSDYYSIGNLQSFSGNTGTVTYTIVGKTTLGTAINRTIVQTYTKAKAGVTTFTWIAYADDAVGTNFSTVAGTRTYVGIASNKTTENPPGGTTYTAYTWSKIKGEDGNKTTTIYASQWSNSGTPAYTQAATYTWSNGAVSAYPSGWAASAGAAPATDYVLYQIRLVISDIASATTTNFNWSSAVSGSIGYRQDGSIGFTGDSARTAYLVNTSSTVPGAVTAGTGNVVPTSGAGTWSFTATSTLSAGQYMYQVDGLLSTSTGNITWGNPYLSNLKVGSLSALAVDTGNLTVSTTGSIKNVGGSYGTAGGFFLGYDTGTYKFSVGDKLTYNGTTLTVPAITINANGTLNNAGTGQVSLGGIGYTGDTNATNGAPANTYVGSTLAQNVESNANTGYANANTAIIAAGQAQSTASGALSAAGQAQTTATSALNSAGTKLSKSSADILSSKITIAPNTADAGFVAGTLAWNTSGDRTSGYGVAMTPKGLVGYAANGTNTFAVNASDGSASFTGAVTATSGTFTGAVYASSGTFTGTVNASSGSFTGAVYASSGSFTGAVYASSGTFTGAVTATSGSFTGAVYASSGFLKGSLYGGVYSSYTWPAANQGASPGFYLGPEGLLLGNNSLYSSTGGAQGGFFQVEANGNVIAPKFSISGGNAYFAGILQAATGTFSGSLSAATGSFTGGVYGGDYLPQYGNNWPYANGANNLSGTGFALTSGGLLLGNYFAWAANPTGGVGYVQITNNGTFNAPGLNISNGNTVLSGSLKVGGAEITTGTNGYNTGISGAGAAIYSNGTFAMGGQTSSIVGNGAAIFLNGTVVANRNISNNAISTVTPFSSYNAGRYSANNFTSNTNTSGANSSFFIVITFEVDLYYYYDASVTKVELTLSSSVDGESGGSTIKLTQGAQTPWPQTQKFQGVISFGQPTLAPSVYTITTYATVKLYNSSNAEVGSMAPPGGSASGIYCTVSGLTQHGFITEVRK